MNSKAYHNRFSGILCVLVAGILLLLGGIVLAGVSVTSSWGPPTVEPFDPENPPSNLGDGGDADAKPSVNASGSFKGTWDGTKLKITDVNVTVTGHTHIREPNDCDPNLHGHEMGHDALNNYEFDENAEDKIKEALEGIEDMEFVGEGATPAARLADARAKAEAELNRRLNKACDAIAKQMDAINVKYDQLTDHGTKEDPNSTEGVDKAKEEKEKAEEAGSNENTTPRDSNTTPSGTGTGPVQVDPNTDKMSVPGGIPLGDVKDPCDTILGRGVADVNEMVMIGLNTDSGALHVSDTVVTIRDAYDPCESHYLMIAPVFNIAYMPSNRTGYAAMIHGYLDIPPAEADGIVNSIGSAWLGKMEAARDAGEYTCFWLYLLDDLYDEEGNWSGIEDTACEMVLGVGMGVYSEVDRFDDHDIAEFSMNWIAEGEGAIDLGEGIGHESNKSMMLNYNTTAGLRYAEAVRQFVVPANWSEESAKVLEVFVDMSGCPPESLGELYVRIMDTAMNSYVYHVCEPAAYSDLMLVDSASSWQSLNIDLRNAEMQGVMLDSIEYIGVGMEAGVGPGSIGMLLVDDIRVQDSRQFGKPDFDTNRDGIVNGVDLAGLANAWLDTTLWP